jgi:4a-hydroxytetrahydrobiopterin dehydratase
MTTQCDIGNRKCQPCEGGVPPLGEAGCRELLAALPGWRLEGEKLVKDFNFRNHYEVLAFVNAVAWVSHREDHHPELSIGYAACQVRYWTHAIGGLSENDFICAAKIEKLLSL